MMALLFCEIGGQGNVSSFSYSSVVLGSFTFPKRYIYDFWVIIWFPIQVDAILRAMKHETSVEMPSKTVSPRFLS